jgi:phage tail sheath protein FI
MAFQLSPGVLVTEKDLTLLVPSVSTTAGGFAGAFQWGPANEVVTVDSETTLVERFGKPNDNTFVDFFTAANFLSYGNNLQLIRVINKSSALNSVGSANTASSSAVLVENEDDYTQNHSSGSLSIEWAAKYPGLLGNSLKVSLADANTFATWQYATNFDDAPNTSTYAATVGGANDELHVIVIDEDGAWTGTTGEVLERFSFVSKASDAKLPDGTSNFYKNVINNRSKYVWWLGHTGNVVSRNWGSAAAGVTFANTLSHSGNVSVSLVGGTASESATDGNVQTAFSILANDELFDISLIPTGGATAATVTHVINNVAEVRLDCVVFCSPEKADVVDNAGSEATDVVAFRDSLPSSSYAVMDSGYKYQYDRYNDVYRYVPLNGDTAGLAVRTDFVADPWFSPAGFNRGQIKNVVKLPFSPKKTDRDTLYKKGVNPVVTFPGQGTVLFGDKTLLAKPSAFDRINVRRLFIVLEKAIATASKFQLFEFNDAFTRAQFRNLVEPFLREVQGRRGITDFKVVCDETNNTGEVIDRNEFVADIFIKPARSINFIQLNFVATRSGISFEEVGG